MGLRLGGEAQSDQSYPRPRRAIAYEKSGRWFTAEEPFLRAKERTDAGSSAFRHPRSELIAPLPQEVEPAFNNRKLHMRLPWRLDRMGLTNLGGSLPARAGKRSRPESRQEMQVDFQRTMRAIASDRKRAGIDHAIIGFLSL